MGLRHDWRRTKTLLAHGGELLLLRLQLLRLDMGVQLAQAAKIAALVLAAALLLMLALVSVLVVAYVLLPPQAKAWVFGGIALFAALAAGLVLRRVPEQWRQCRAQTAHTLAAMRDDFHLLQRHLRPDSHDVEILPPEQHKD